MGAKSAKTALIISRNPKNKKTAGHETCRSTSQSHPKLFVNLEHGVLSLVQLGVLATAL